MGKTLCSLLLLATVLSYGRCKSVNPRNTGVGSGASAGEKPEELFPPVAATTTSAPTDPPNTNTNVDPARLAELYKALGCLNVGSSATGINDNSINYIDFENGSPSSQGEQHRINCSVLLPACHDRVDLVFLLDASGSVELANFNKEKDFIAQSISRFFISPKDAQVSVVTFSNQPSNAFNLNQYQNKASIVAGVNQIPYVAGGTYTSSALAYVRENSFTAGAGDRPDARNVLVVMTDGKSTDPMQTVLEAAKLKQSNITTIVLGIGSGVDQKELNTIASTPSYVLNVDDFDALRHVYGAIHEISCIIDQTTTPMPTTTPIPTTTQEPKTQEPSTKEPTTQEPTTMEPTTMEPATQEPSTPVPTPVVCRDKADLVYLLDSSGSVGIGNFKKEQNFIAQSLSRFVIGPNDTQVSVAMFSNEPVSAFNLSDYQDKASIVTAVNNMTYIAGGTYTSSALAFVRDISFSSEAGGRSDVRNVLVVITDGKSTDPAQTIKEAKTLHGTNISVIAVGIGSGVDNNELNVIATDPQYVLNVDDFDALIKIYGSVHELACKIINTGGAITGSSVGKPTTAKPGPIVTTTPPSGAGTTSAIGGVSSGTVGTSTGTGGTGTGTGGGPTKSSSNSGSSAGSGSTSIPVTATSGGKTPLPQAGLTPDTLTPDNFTDYNHTDCRDLINCRPYPKERICPSNSSYFPWANVRCRAYCGICIVNTPPPPCVNKISNCNEYDADLCTNPLYRLFREDNCQLFCGLCTTADAGTSPPPPPNRRDDEEEDIFFV